MAAGQSNYTHGEMPVEAQSGTFKGFMGMTFYGGAAIALIVIYPTLVFGTPLSWLASLIVTMIVGVVLGIALKLKGGYYAAMVAGAVLFAIASFLLTLIVPA